MSMLQIVTLGLSKAEKTRLAEELTAMLSMHSGVRPGVMASPNHWAYHNPAGRWFAHCSTQFQDEGEHGCGWDSEPHCYPTKEQAIAAGVRHQVDMVMEALS